MSTVTRLSINLAPTVAQELRRQAAIESMSITETIRHAIAVYSLVADAQRRGETVIIRSPDGRAERAITLMGGAK